MKWLSHLVRVRGLKPLAWELRDTSGWSHLVRVRGLKQDIKGAPPAPQAVAPRAGAWIETIEPLLDDVGDSCRTSCGCVD